MSKAVMISIRPKWCEKIARGEKTIEVRKTRPKLETPFKCYIYCTKAKERLIGILKDGDENYGEIYHGKSVFIKVDEGSVCDMWGKRQKVIGEFTCSKIELVVRGTSGKYAGRLFVKVPDPDGGIRFSGYKEIKAYEKQMCLSESEIVGYLSHSEPRGRGGYLWHISGLKIYDTPRELGEFTGLQNTRFGAAPYEIKRAPQSWRYVEEQK